MTTIQRGTIVDIERALRDIMRTEPFLSSYITSINHSVLQEKLSMTNSTSGLYRRDQNPTSTSGQYRSDQYPSKKRDRTSAVFSRTPPSYWFGYTYQLLPISSRMRVTLSQTGLLSKTTRDNMSVSVVAKVTLRTIHSESHKSVMIVDEGEQKDMVTFYFKGVYLELLRHAVIEFSVYLIKGFLKRKYLHSHWEVPLYRKDMSRKMSDWKPMVPL